MTVSTELPPRLEDLWGGLGTLNQAGSRAVTEIYLEDRSGTAEEETI